MVTQNLVNSFEAIQKTVLSCFKRVLSFNKRNKYLIIYLIRLTDYLASDN